MDAFGLKVVLAKLATDPTEASLPARLAGPKDEVACTENDPAVAGALDGAKLFVIEMSLRSFRIGRPSGMPERVRFVGIEYLRELLLSLRSMAKASGYVSGSGGPCVGGVGSGPTFVRVMVSKGARVGMYLGSLRFSGPCPNWNTGLFSSSPPSRPAYGSAAEGGPTNESLSLEFISAAILCAFFCA